MIELLRDPLWQFIGAIFAFIAIGITILIFWLQRSKKSLGYELMSNASLLTIKEELEGKLQILYEKQSVKNVQLFVIKFINTGNQPISSSDYEKPLRLIFNNKEKILSAEITERNPDNLSVSLITNEDNVEITPTLLNSKDSLTIKALISNYSEKPKIDARIIGVKHIRAISDGYWTRLLFAILGMIIAVSSVVYLITTTNHIDVENTNQKLVIALFFIGYGISFLSVISSKKLRGRFLKTYFDK